MTRPPITTKRTRPRVLDERQLELVTAICEAIIPETDTAGATAAGVPLFIDFTLSKETAPVRVRFVQGLEWLTRTSMSWFDRAFDDLDPERQVAFLEALEAAQRPEGDLEFGAAFLRDIKNRTIYAYYTSVAGLLRELGYKGNVAQPSFLGCDHAGHRRPRSR